MTESIRVFSVMIGPPGSEYTNEELDLRKKSILTEIITIIPSVKYLMGSTLSESIVVENNQLVLAFNLTESPQMEMCFTTDKRQTRNSPLARMMFEAQKLRDAAEHSQIRIGELSHLASAISQDNQAAENLFDLSQDEKSLWQLMYTKRNKTLRLKFPDEDIIYQFPDIPVYFYETGTRFIRANVHRISAKNAELSNLAERTLNDGGTYHQPLPKKLLIHRPVNSERARHWPLLHAAVDCHSIIEAEVRVALRADNQAPAYLELVDISNLESLRTTFASWVQML
ncbi:MAG: hypothetical protein PHC51_12995 [bacterium]|nr:hypothetical protein [bacterium]